VRGVLSPHLDYRSFGIGPYRGSSLTVVEFFPTCFPLSSSRNTLQAPFLTFYFPLNRLGTVSLVSYNFQSGLSSLGRRGSGPLGDGDFSEGHSPPFLFSLLRPCGHPFPCIEDFDKSQPGVESLFHKRSLPASLIQRCF